MINPVFPVRICMRTRGLKSCQETGFFESATRFDFPNFLSLGLPTTMGANSQDLVESSYTEVDSTLKHENSSWKRPRCR